MTALAQLVDVSQRVCANAARTSKVRELAQFLRTLTANEVGIAVHYLSGDTPQGRGGIGFALLQRAAARTGVADPALTLIEVDRLLSESHRSARSWLPRPAGQTPSSRCWVVRPRLRERQFLTALLVGELRQGALGGVMVDAIAAAADLPSDQVRHAAMFAPNLGAAATAALAGGAAALQEFQFELFSPVAPMLAQTAADVAEALQTLPGELAFEWKLDGARIQVHKRREEVRIFTRTLKDVTLALPEIVEAVRGFAAESVVLDGEAIALGATGRPLPLPDHDAPFRSPAQRRADSPRIADECLLLRLSFLDGSQYCGIV